MKNKKHEVILNYEWACKQIANKFIQDYFGRLPDVEHWWVGNEIGGVLYTNDHFFNLSTMVDFIKYKYTKKQMFSYYEYCLQCIDKKTVPVNIKNWKKLK